MTAWLVKGLNEQEVRKRENSTSSRFIPTHSLCTRSLPLITLLHHHQNHIIMETLRHLFVNTLIKVDRANAATHIARSAYPSIQSIRYFKSKPSNERKYCSLVKWFSFYFNCFIFSYKTTEFFRLIKCHHLILKWMGLRCCVPRPSSSIYFTLCVLFFVLFFCFK